MNPRKQKLIIGCLPALSLVVSVQTLSLQATIAQATPQQKNDPVVFTFATVGDSREDPASTLSAQDAIWLQNTKAWSRILREIQQQKPNALFFNGDMIMGYTKDQNILNRQYAFWRGMVSHLMETGTYVVPVPGNHEMQIKMKDENKKTIKRAQPENEIAWRNNMGDLILEENLWKNLTGQGATSWNVENKPSTNGPDGITTNQKQLSWSFDSHGFHFVIMNTDAVGLDSHAPVHWLEADLKDAQKRGAKWSMVFGHKMAFPYIYSTDKDVLDGIGHGLDEFPDNQTAFWNLIEKNHATYFCGHQHIYHASQPWKNKGGKAWQVLAGTAGSPFEAPKDSLKKTNNRKFAWVKISLHQSGKVHADTFAFDEAFGKTETLESWDIN